MCYKEKINRLIYDGISKVVHVIEEKDNALAELILYDNFLYRNFKKHKKHKEMRRTSNQLATDFATGRTHKSTDIKETNINDLEVRPIIDQTDTHL